MTEAQTPQRPTSEADVHAPGNLIPMWLAVLVLALLLAVMGVGGYVIRGVVAGEKRALSPQEADIESWRSKVREKPQDPSAHLGLGYAYQNAGRYDKALDEYATVLEKDPRDTAALYNRGVVYLKLDVGRKAEESFWAVLAVEPTHVLAAKELGEYYTGKKQFRSAVRAVRPAAEAHPEMSDLQYLMGLSYEKLGNKEWAIARYKAALKYTPDLQPAIEGLKRLEVTQ
jgi:tetratricopeptide (TPR) repeat protein